jgi:hypothetical protein
MRILLNFPSKNDRFDAKEFGKMLSLPPNALKSMPSVCPAQSFNMQSRPFSSRLAFHVSIGLNHWK